jgi:TorA maturation chaperone TorD
MITTPKQVRDYWTTVRSEQLSQMDPSDADRFFEELAQQITDRTMDLATSLEGSDEPGESYLEKVGRVNRASSAARERAWSELVYEPFPSTSDQESEAPTDHEASLNEMARALREEQDLAEQRELDAFTASLRNR